MAKKFKKIYNFSPGPAMLPYEVMRRIQQEFLDFNSMGLSIVEISHRSPEFIAVMDRASELFRQLTSLPDNYKILYVHGGARMQFAAIAMNLISRSKAKTAYYVDTGIFAQVAAREGQRYGNAITAASSKETGYDRIPAIRELSGIDHDAAYLHLTSNNTLYGTRWHEFPEAGKVPLVIDATSEMLARQMDYSRFGLIYAGMQKNLGVAGLALVVIREDLLQDPLPCTPMVLNYKMLAKDNSLTNTTGTFAIYVAGLMLEWLKEQGGIAACEKNNETKAQLIYDILDHSSFYHGVAHPEHRSTMNVTFNLAIPQLEERFLAQATTEGLYALKGHYLVGGIRASLYNAMPIEGARALAEFMREFERVNG